MNDKVEHAGMVGIFTTPVFLSTITDETIIDDAVDNVLKLKETTPGVDRVNNWVTDDNLQTLPEFKELADILLQESKRALDEMTVIRDSDYITCMWANEAPIGTAHAEHIHSNSLWSGVLYLRVPEGSSPTLFSDPRPIANMIRPDYENASPYFLGARWGQLPKKGNMIIFPSWLPHSVETVPAVEDAETRIVLSWNIMIHSKVQFDTAKIEYLTMLVIDDFLPDADFKTMQNELLGDNFPWYFLPTVSRPPGSYMPPGSTETYGWFHNFYSKEDGFDSVTMDIIQPLLDKIVSHENAEFIRIRASLKTQLKGFTENDYNLPHVDYNYPHKSIIYYLNESDGDTWMFNEKFTKFPEPDKFTVKDRITPKPNRLLVFDGLDYHTASNPINSTTRFIININYK